MTLLGHLYAKKVLQIKQHPKSCTFVCAFLSGKHELFGNVAVLAAIEALPIAGIKLHLTYLLLRQFFAQAQSAYSVTQIHSS